MKYTLLTTGGLLLSLIIFQYATAQFRYAPERPQVGEVVSFTYSPQNTPLAADSTLEGRYVRYGEPAVMRLSKPTSVTLARRGGSFVGELKIPKQDVAGLMLLFRNSRQPLRTDLNNGHGYVIPVHDGSGQLLPHAVGGQASVFMRTGLLYEHNARPDYAYVLSLYEQELRQRPDLRSQYWADRLATIVKQKKPGFQAVVKAEIDTYLTGRIPTNADLTAAVQLYESLGDFAKANATRERLKTLDPNSSLAQKDRAMAIRSEADWTRRKALYQSYVRDYPTSTYLPMLGVLMADGYFKANDIKSLATFVEQLPPAQVDPMALNTMAGQLAEEKRALPDAERLIRRAIAVQQEQPKPAGFSTDWTAEKQRRQRQLTNTLARTLDQQGRDADAYVAYHAAANPDEADSSDPRTNEHYYACALRTNHATDARPMAEAAVRTGRATKRLKATLHSWYAQQPRQNAATADAYLTALEADLKAEQRDELRERLIDEPAPAFALTDLLGRTISSSAFKGKVIVLDFWATWCAPCIASFPAMQEAQARFQGDPNVRFLFVNTREGGRVHKVQEFMDKNPYPFVVPLDTQQKVSTAYGVLGIPTKVVIGPNGRIRYRAAGYTGTPEQTVEEITMIVEMLKE